MIRRPPRSTRVRSSAASDVYKRQVITNLRPADLGESIRHRPSDLRAPQLTQRPAQGTSHEILLCARRLQAKRECLLVILRRHCATIQRWRVSSDGPPSFCFPPSLSRRAMSLKDHEQTFPFCLQTISLGERTGAEHLPRSATPFKMRDHITLLTTKNVRHLHSRSGAPSINGWAGSSCSVTLPTPSG